MKKYNKYGMLMFEEFDGFGGGESKSSTDGNDEAIEAETKSQATPVVDAKALAEQFGEVIGKQFKQQEEATAKQQQSRQPTPEERAAARKQFGMVDIDDDILAKLDNLETRKETWQNLVNRIYESQGNITAAQLASLNKSWEDRFQPVHQMLTQREESERVSRFHKTYPALADENLAPVLSGVGQKLAEQGAFKGLTESQAFDVLAKGVESVIKHHNPSFSLTKTNPGKSSNEIPVETSGSRGGGGQARGEVKADSPNGLFGPVKPRKG